jgi:hypothetical protein
MMDVAHRTRVASISGLLVLALGSSAAAQAELQGHVFAEGGRRPLTNAEITVAGLSLRSETDSLGRYRLPHIPRGEHLIVTRAVGFRPDSNLTAFDGDETLVADIVLDTLVTTLQPVAVHGSREPVRGGKMVGYEERKALGAGHFIDRDVLDKQENQKLGDVLSSRMPGLAIYHGKEMRAWAATGRVRKSAGCTLCSVPAGELLDPADIAAGAPLVCYLDVYLDGLQVYNAAMHTMPLFNLNTLNPRDIEAIEVYTGSSQIPPQYNKTAGMCGVMLIWLRDRR